jgi:hypothetical protein
MDFASDFAVYGVESSALFNILSAGKRAMAAYPL